ncbi:MAG: PAS domain S-box protein [Verrucomicrobia bacterium]|nr:PAS domain S-box protein [Verrucomicrobiota bacterium]
MVGLVANGELVMTEYHAQGKIVPANYRFRPGQGVAGYVMSSKLTYYSNDPLEDPLVLPEVQRDFHLHNLVGVPVLGRGGQLLGCLELHNTENQQALGENDLTALEVLAGGAAIAIENAQLLEAQRRAEARSRRLAESAVDVIWSVDLDLRFTDVTPSAALLFGYTPAEMIGRSIFELLAPESAAVVKQAVGQGLKRDRLAQKDVTWSRLMEVEQVRKDGTRVWVEAKVRILVDENKAPVGFAGVTRDISDRRRAQAEIERTLALHAASLKSVPDGILVVDTEGRMVNFNQRFVHMWRIPKALIETRQDERALQFVLSQLKEPEAFLSKVKQLYATPDAESHDHIAFKDGRVFERFSSPQRVRGQVTGRVWSFRDVTARAEAKAIRAASRAGRSKPRSRPD